MIAVLSGASSNRRSVQSKRVTFLLARSSPPPILLTSDRPQPLLSVHGRAAFAAIDWHAAQPSTHLNSRAEVIAMSKPPKSRKRYGGEFLKPIHRSSKAKQQQIDKFINLFAVYDVDLDVEDDPFLLLAIKLANAHVPGLRIVEDRGGRARTWKAGLWKDLVRDVAARKAKRKMSTRTAIRALREEDPKWAQFTQENLETRHREGVKLDRRRDGIARALLAQSRNRQ